MAYSNCTVGGSTSLWRTVTAPVKDEDDLDQERASLTCEWCLVALGGLGDSRASGLASGVWCLLEGTVTAGQAELRLASQWSLAKRTTGIASSHLGLSIQEQQQAEARWRQALERCS